MRESMKEILSTTAPDQEPRPKIIANNTVQYYRDGCKVIRLHQTDIIVWSADGKTCRLYSGGYLTRTTKDRLNTYAPGRTRIYTHKGIWYIAPNVAFTEGVELDATTGAIVEYAKAARRAAREGAAKTALAKQIEKFVKRIHDLPELPQPSAGDCWHCSMFNARPSNDNRESGYIGIDTKTKDADTEHLLSHVKEGYLHGSLIINAMRWAGRTDFAIQYQYQHHKQDKVSGRYHGRESWAARDLRRYLRAQLGLGN